MADPGDSDLRTKVLKEAEKKLQQNYLGASDDNCAHFVRDCFRDAGYIPVLAETKHPSDLAICQQNGYPLGPLYANSLAGDEIGRKLPVEQAQPGDIVLFTNVGASSTSFARGAITHVGICVGDSMMIDHGSSGMHKRDFRNWPGAANYAEARRPKLFDIPRTRIHLENGKLTQTLRNTKTYSIDILVNLRTSGPAGFLRQEAGKLHMAGVGGGLDVFVNSARVYHYKAVWLRLNDIASGKLYKLSYQHGHTTASVNDGKVPDLKCQITSGGGSLHVRVNDKEVRVRDAVVEIVYAS
jgi:hypothetical protein